MQGGVSGHAGEVLSRGRHRRIALKLVVAVFLGQAETNADEGKVNVESQEWEKDVKERR